MRRKPRLSSVSALDDDDDDNDGDNDSRSIGGKKKMHDEECIAVEILLEQRTE